MLNAKGTLFASTPARSCIAENAGICIQTVPVFANTDASAVVARNVVDQAFASTGERGIAALRAYNSIRL